MLIKNKSISTVILLGGSGSRFSSINEPPKHLSKLNNDFILMHIINYFKKYGLNHFIFPLGFKKNFFSKFFYSKKNISKYKFNILKKKFKIKDLNSNKINISLFDAGKSTNKLSRIYKSLNYIINNDFLVAYGDDLSNINLNQTFKKFYKYKRKKAIVSIFRKKSQYGHVIVDRKGIVKKFLEKPPHQYPVNIGNYLLTSSLIRKYRQTRHELENNFLPILAKRKLLLSNEHKGYFYSINDKKELIIAKKKLKKF